MRGKTLSRTMVPIIMLTMFLIFCSLGPALAESASKTEIQIYSNPFGNATYVLSFALAEIINKNSTQLHATCLESKGSAANILYLQKNPDALKNTVILGNQFAIKQAQRADPPFKEAFTGLKAIALIGNMGAFFVTLNPDIKTVQDLEGKSLALGPKGITLDYVPRYVLDYGAGVYKKIKRVNNTPFGAIKDALLDGTLDVGLQSSVMWGEGEEKEWVPIPATDELLATKKCYLVEIPDGAGKKAREKSGYPIYLQKAKPIAFGKSDAFGGNRMIWSNSWWVHESMGGAVVNEICSIIYDHAGEFVKYHASGRAITAKTMSSVAASESDFHPAAVKFYKEKGLPIGL